MVVDVVPVVAVCAAAAVPLVEAEAAVPVTIIGVVKPAVGAVGENPHDAAKSSTATARTQTLASSKGVRTLPTSCATTIVAQRIRAPNRAKVPMVSRRDVHR